MTANDLWVMAIIIVGGLLVVGAVLEQRRWREVKNTGVWSYQEHAKSGKRRILQIGDGYQPKDHAWIERGGEPYTGPQNPPPVGPLPDKGGAGRRPPFLDPWGE